MFKAPFSVWSLGSDTKVLAIIILDSDGHVVHDDFHQLGISPKNYACGELFSCLSDSTFTLS
jgi:hypothetical protein